MYLFWVKTDLNVLWGCSWVSSNVTINVYIKTERSLTELIWQIYLTVSDMNPFPVESCGLPESSSLRCIHDSKCFSNAHYLDRSTSTRRSSAVCKSVWNWSCFLWCLQRPSKTPNQQRRPFQMRMFNRWPVKCKILSNRQTALDDGDSLFLCLSSLFWCGNDFLMCGGSFPVRIDHRRTQASICPALLRLWSALLIAWESFLQRREPSHTHPTNTCGFF